MDMTQTSTLTDIERRRWFRQARFGMYIHWGLYSLLERGEWTMFEEAWTPEEYAPLADRFNPEKFDADAWARLAVDAGAKYMVFTTRHHDGFCLFDSQVSDFTSVQTAARRDFVAEYVEAARRAGLRVGLYYSLLDWRFPGYFTRPEENPENFQAMVQQAHDQVRELMTNYGKIDILWYDGGWFPYHDGAEGDILTTWGDLTTLHAAAERWRAVELNAMARKLQPHILINNRAGIQEDFDTPEQEVTASAEGRVWEANMTIGDFCGWGYIRHNPNMKTVVQLIQHLVSAAGGEGNLNLNIGPLADGTVREEESTRLRAIGKWLRVNGEAIYDSRRAPFHGGMVGLTTMQGEDTVYLHAFRWPVGEMYLINVPREITRATVLATGQPLEVAFAPNARNARRFRLRGFSPEPPDPYCSVIKLEMT
ncbi:MAG: alpha-L-fucosidase [Armatimonadota bacterium]